MQIRLLNQSEIQWASNVASEVYHTCVLPYAKSQLEVEQFRSNICVGCLMQEVQQGRLFMWGVFEDGQLCAVSAMQSVGHITLLYVNPYYQRRGYATSLISAMRMFALSNLRLQRITINVQQAQLVAFFCKRGFHQIQGVVNGGDYISMDLNLMVPNNAMPMMQNQPWVQNATAINYVQMPQPKPKKEVGVTYTPRKVNNKVILITVGVVFFLLFTIGIGYTIGHLSTL